MVQQWYTRLGHSYNSLVDTGKTSIRYFSMVFSYSGIFMFCHAATNRLDPCPLPLSCTRVVLVSHPPSLCQTYALQLGPWPSPASPYLHLQGIQPELDHGVLQTPLSTFLIITVAWSSGCRTKVQTEGAEKGWHLVAAGNPGVLLALGLH